MPKTPAKRKSKKRADGLLPLTHDNYYTAFNTAVSNSKVGTFLVSPEYFFRKYIAHEVEDEMTPSMKVGRMVDSLISGEPISFRTKCLKSEDPVAFEENKTMHPDTFVTEDNIRVAKGLTNAIMKEPFFDELVQNGVQLQKILQGYCEGVEVCGMADFYTDAVDIDTVFIDDVKTSNPHSVSSVKAWARHCKDFGYFRQLAHYQEMAMEEVRKQKRGRPTRFVCRHIVATKVNDYVYKITLFVISPAVLRAAYKEFKEAVVAMKNTTLWVDPPVTWQGAKELKLRDLPWSPDMINVDAEGWDDEVLDMSV